MQEHLARLGQPFLSSNQNARLSKSAALGTKGRKHNGGKIYGEKKLPPSFQNDLKNLREKYFCQKRLKFPPDVATSTGGPSGLASKSSSPRSVRWLNAGS